MIQIKYLNGECTSSLKNKSVLFSDDNILVSKQRAGNVNVIIESWKTRPRPKQEDTLLPYHSDTTPPSKKKIDIYIDKYQQIKMHSSKNP